MLLNLFPTPVGIFNIENYEEINEDIKNILTKDYEFLEDKNFWDLKDSYPVIKKLHDIFLQKSIEYSKEIFGFSYENKFFHERGWLSVREPYREVILHNHRMTCIAATYYVDVNSNSGSLDLVDPRSTLGWVSLDQKKHYNKFTFQPSNGDMILFPGWLLHYVKQNRSDKNRISISTNISLLP